jgi:serine phosphatase RsbU (regulator of sigma subunit)
MKKLSFISLLVLGFLVFGRGMLFSQQNKIDSLKQVLKTLPKDTNRVNAYKLLGNLVGINVGNYDTALVLYNQSLELAQKLNYQRGLGACYMNIGAVYQYQANYPKALEYYLKAIKIKEQTKDKKGVAKCFGNLGMIYDAQKNYTKAIEYHQRGLNVLSELGNKDGVAICYSNIGSTYNKMLNHEKAIEYQLKSLKIREEINDLNGIARCYGNIGIAYFDQAKYREASEYYLKGLPIFKQIGDLQATTNCFVNLSNVSNRLKDYKKGIAYGDSALQLSKKIGIVDQERLSYLNLSTAYYNVANYKEAYENHVKFEKLTDSIFNIENSNIISDLKTNFEVEKKEAELKAKADAQEIITQAQKQKQGLILILVSFVLLLTIIFAVFMYRRYKLTQLQRNIIEHQKHKVEEHQKEISDSVNYAKRIQTSFLANEVEFNNHFNDYFILFKPKDVVSGDFYWATSNENKLFVCVADSTGHGIPGAFMSLLNISLLNESVLSRNFMSTVDILNFVRNILILGLKPDERGQGGNDGMDCSLFAFDIKTLQIEFSGANNPLWIVRDGKIIELKADKMPVGRSPKELESFSSYLFQLQKNDLIYAFTDGYADQFGGPKGKKFKYKQLEELILSNSEKLMSQQKQNLDTTFENWKGNLEQVDDVCIVGLRV